MARLFGVRELWKFVILTLISAIALLAGPTFATALLESAGSRGWVRMAAVAVSIVPPAVLVGYMAWLYRRSDEFERHDMLLRLATGFAVAAIATTAIDSLATARFIPSGSLGTSWWLFIAAWWIGSVVVTVARKVMD